MTRWFVRPPESGMSIGGPVEVGWDDARAAHQALNPWLVASVLTLLHAHAMLHQLPEQHVLHFGPPRKVVPVDDLSFDQLARRLGAQRTRRASLQALAGGTLAAVVLAEASSTEAKKRRKKCKAPKVKCGRKLCCAAGQQCLDGACVTPTTTTTTTSTTTTTIPACSPACGVGQVCVGDDCECDATLCAAATNPNPGETACNCFLTGDGQTQCAAGQSCVGHVDCGTLGSCPEGFVCQVFGCGNQPTCVKTCI